MKAFNVYVTDEHGRTWIVQVNAKTPEQAEYAARDTVKTRGGLGVAIAEGRARLSSPPGQALLWGFA